MSIFQIQDLFCAYEQGKTVLHVPRLNIREGQLIFIVGVSGGGKSTLIETLGLMNNTISSKCSENTIRFRPRRSVPVPLATYWSCSDQDRSDLRKRNFSFIFQQTNLMPNFTAGENMLITALMSGASRKEARLRIEALMDRIGLPERAFSAQIQQLSGGQRQRLAFIRALVSEFQVLFGDEPTGNLDKHTASDCFTVLREVLNETKKTAIIVSHDLVMAKEYADMIIPIVMTRDEISKEQFGTVNERLILTRNSNGFLQKPTEAVVEDPIVYLERLTLNHRVNAY